MGKLKNNRSTYRHPSEESNSEVVWNARNDNNITRPYNQIPDETYTEDLLIEAIDTPKEFEEPYEETYNIDKIDHLIKEQDFWGLEQYLLRFPEGSEYIQFHYPKLGENGESKEDSLEWIENRYPEYFPKKGGKIKEALVEVFDEEKDYYKEPHSVQKKGDKYLVSSEVQNNFYRKGTPKKDRRHGKEDIGKKDRRTSQNRRRRKETKKDLKDLLAA